MADPNDYHIDLPQDLTSTSWERLDLISSYVGRHPNEALHLIGKEVSKVNIGSNGTVDLQCVDVGAYDRADGKGKAGFVFMMKQVTNNAYQMNETQTNNGGYASMTQWTAHANELKEMFPSEIKAVIKRVMIPYSVVTNYGDSQDDYDIRRMEAEVFNASAFEIFGDTPVNYGSSIQTRKYPKEGSQFRYYQGLPTSTSSYQKLQQSGGDRGHYWTRTPTAESSKYTWNVVEGDGYRVSSYVTQTNVHVASCFCV